MLRGLYSAATGMIAQQRRHDAITNNIANINTPGYKQTSAITRSFPEMLLAMTGVNGVERTSIGRWTSGVFAEESLPLYTQGDLMQTNRATDFAIVSELGRDGVVFDASGKAIDENGQAIFRPQAFFTVQDGNGEIRYTRGGRFTVSAEGDVLSSDGVRVLGADGEPLRLPPGANLDELALGPNQSLFDADGNDTGLRLLISIVDNPNNLVREGNGYFRLEAEGDDAVRVFDGEENVAVRQGYIERSNVDPAQSAVDLMAAFRAYEMNQKVIQMYDQSLQKTVNEIGRV